MSFLYCYLSLLLFCIILQTKKVVEEVPLKRMDRLSATETEIGHASVTDRRKSEEKNMEMPLK